MIPFEVYGIGKSTGNNCCWSLKLLLVILRSSELPPKLILPLLKKLGSELVFLIFSIEDSSITFETISSLWLQPRCWNISLIIFFLGKINFPAPNKLIKQEIPRENLKIVK